MPDNDDIQDLLKAFERLCAGRGNGFLSEESFERIIDHFDDINSLSKAMEAAEMGVLQYPYSCTLLVKKADLLIANRQYKRALVVLDKAEILDRNDIDIYVLRTDAYLALDMQDKAVALLEDVISQFDGEERIDLLFELADVYDDYEAFEKIFDCLKLILDYDPNNEEALYKICFWTDFTGRSEESIRLHLKIIEDFPYNDLAWFNLAAAYQGLRLFEKSIEASEQRVAIVKTRQEIGVANQADLLQSSLDLNALLQAKQTQYIADKWSKLDMSLYNQSVYYEPNRMSAYYDYESMEFTPEISAALDIYAEESTTLSEKGELITIFSESSRVTRWKRCCPEPVTR